MNIEQAFLSDRAELSALEFLADEIQLSKKKLKDCFFKGGIWLKHVDTEPYRLREPEHQIKDGDEIHIYYDDHYLSMRSPKLHRLQHSQDLSLWQKPEGIIETISLYSDHLNLDRVLELSLPAHQDVHHIFPNLAYCTGPLLIAHSRRSASQLQQWIDDENIQFSISGKANQEFYDYLKHTLNRQGITISEMTHSEQKSPKLQHTSGTCEFSILAIKNQDAVDTISTAFMQGFEKYDDGRSQLSIDSFDHPVSFD